MNRISVVVPNWNGAVRLERLLETLSHQTARALEIIVVDNASQDNSEAVVRQAATARFVPLDHNYGFAHAVNIGIRQAQGDSVAILNNDVTLAAGCFEKLAAALDDYWFAAPKVLMARDPAKIDGTFDLTSRGFCSWRAGNGFAADQPAWNCGAPIQSAPMTAALFRRSVFERIGELDEQFGSYLEDVDFGLRCAGQGVTGWYEPSAIAWHEGSATLGAWKPATVRLIARNQVLLARKYHRAGGTWPVVAGQLAWGLLALKNHTGWAWIQGKIEGCRQPAHTFEMNSVSTSIASTLTAQERAIRNLLAQEEGPSQSYWSLYFSLCGRPN
jgi:GT2 family glycosyltransferase